MPKTLILTACILFWSFGCVNKNNKVFMEVVRDHKVLTVETCDALILSIDDAIRDTLDENGKKSLLSMKQRLEAVKRQSILIEQFVFTAADTKVLQEYIRETGDTKNGNK